MDITRKYLGYSVRIYSRDVDGTVLYYIQVLDPSGNFVKESEITTSNYSTKISTIKSFIDGIETDRTTFETGLESGL